MDAVILWRCKFSEELPTDVLWKSKHVTQGMGKTGRLEPGEYCRGGHESCLWTYTGLSYRWGVKLVL